MSWLAQLTNACNSRRNPGDAFPSYFLLTIKEKTLSFVVAHELHVNHYRVEGEIWQFDFHLRHNDIKSN